MGDPNFQPGRIRAEQVREKILAGFPADTEVLVQDMNGDGYHFQVWVSSEAFRGLSKVQQHQKVLLLLREDFKDALHALTLKTEIRGGV